MALRSHLERRAQLNSFSSHCCSTSSWGADPRSLEGRGNSLVPVNDRIKMGFLSNLTDPTLHICGGWRWWEQGAICRMEHLPVALSVYSTAHSKVCIKKWLAAAFNKEQKAPIPLPLPRTCTFLLSACESSVVLSLVVTVW